MHRKSVYREGKLQVLHPTERDSWASKDVLGVVQKVVNYVSSRGKGRGKGKGKGKGKGHTRGGVIIRG